MKIIYPPKETKAKEKKGKLPEQYTLNNRQTAVNKIAECLKEFFEDHKALYTPLEMTYLTHSAITKLTVKDKLKK